jgi:hypothetical protein
MAPTLITPSVIAASALATLYNTTVLLPLVNRDYQDDFNGKQGDTITVRTPATFEVNEFDRANGIVIQEGVEGSFTVTLDKLLDVSFKVDSEVATLELDRFEERLLNPALEAFSQDIDGRLAEALVDAANAGGGGGVVVVAGSSASDQIQVVRKAKTKLTRKKLPQNDRHAVYSPEGAEALTMDPTLLQANTSGSTEALREGAVGRLSGMNGYETQTLGEGSGDKGGADGIAFHRSAVAAVTRTLEAPEGVSPSQVSVKNYKGLGLRVVKAYDINKKSDVCSVDLLFGTKAVRPQGAVELDFKQGS